MKSLIRQYVTLAQIFSAEARRDRIKDRANPAAHHFEQYLCNRSISRAYMHAARLVKDEMKSQANHRRVMRRVKKETRAAYQVGADLRKAA